MKFTIEKDVLFKALQRVTSVVEKRNTIPILANVVLDASDDGLRLKATDLDMEISELVECEVEESGAVTLHAFTLREIVGRFSGGGTVAFADDPEAMRVSVKSGRSRFNLFYLPVTDFPDVSLGIMPHRFRLPVSELLAVFNCAQVAMSTDETRYYLNGIYLHAADTDNGWRLRGVATDGHRLARQDVPLPEGAQEMPGVILPRKMVREAIKLLTGVRGEILVQMSPNKVRLAFGDICIVSKLIDGTFPDYMRVIPTEDGHPMQANCELLSQAVGRIAVVSDASGVPVKFCVSNDELTIRASGTNADAVEGLPVTYEGGALEIGFNARYIADLLAQIGGEFVTFSMSGPSAPAVIRDSGDDGVLYVLMPMRV